MVFHCKEFNVEQSDDVFKITTDATLIGALSLNGVDAKSPINILEVGTGTGIISLMLAQRFIQAELLALDNNPRASILCKKNFGVSQFANRLEYIENDIMNFDSSIKFDHIVINPPYYLNDTKSKTPVGKLSRHMNGFTYKELIDKLGELLKVKGSIHMIHPERYIENIEKSIEGSFLNIVRRILIRHNKNKPVQNVITEIKKLNDRSISKRKFSKIYFNLRNTDQSFSSEYIDSLKDFLTIF